MHIDCSAEEFQSLVGRPTKRRRAWRADSLPLMKWTQKVYQQVMRDIGSRPAERGGILLGPDGENLATHFILDETGEGTGVSWTYGHVRINEILKQHANVGLDMKAFVHSHPSGVTSLSFQDLTDFRKPFANPKNEDLDEIWAPILVDGHVYPYILYRSRPQPVAAQLVLC